MFQYVDYQGVGGLSNRWGAGCAKLSKEDLGVSHSVYSDLVNYYEIAEKMMGIYYHGPDLLDEYAGSFKESLRKLNNPKTLIFKVLGDQYCEVGRSRQAILTEPNGDRGSCNNCGGCFVYCKNKSIFNARDLLATHTNYYEQSIATKIDKFKSHYVVEIDSNDGAFCILSECIIMAAGTLGTLKLISPLLADHNSTSFHHSQISRSIFVNFSKEKVNNFPMGQHLVRIKIDANNSAYASLTHAISVPTSDLLNTLPIKNRVLYWLLDKLKKHVVVAMIFYSSKYSNYRMHFAGGNIIKIDSAPSENFKLVNSGVVSRLNKFLSKNGLHSLSFMNSVLPLGSDIHYGGTIPLGNDSLGCNENCEVNGLKNIYIIDGSWMPKISEKSHTFTLIANAIRVADIIAKRVKHDC